MVFDQENTTAAQGVARSMAAEAYSLVEKVKSLESELAALKRSNVSAPTSLQLETARQEIANLRTRLDTNLSSLGRWSPGLLSWRRISSWARAAFSGATWKMLIEGLSANECSAWKAAHVVLQKRGPSLDCMLARGPNRECTLLLALRLSTLSRGPSRDCTSSDCSA